MFCRWGNTLSGKMFVGKDFVLKHIRTKHAEKVDEYKTQVKLCCNTLAATTTCDLPKMATHFYEN